MKYIVLISGFFITSICSALAQLNKIPNAIPSKYDNLKKIETPAKMSRDSAIILLNNKFYRLSELKEYNNTIDGVNIESIDVVRDRAQISKNSEWKDQCAGYSQRGRESETWFFQVKAAELTIGDENIVRGIFKK